MPAHILFYYTPPPVMGRLWSPINVAYRLGGSLIRAPDYEESELSALLLMYADDLVLLTTSELHLESALEILDPRCDVSPITIIQVQGEYLALVLALGPGFRPIFIHR